MRKLMLLIVSLFLSITFLSQYLSAQTFTEVIGMPFMPTSNRDVVFADINGDGSQDVFLAGHFYLNNGMGNFSLMPTSLPLGEYDAVAFADVDGDNDQDIFITGQDVTDSANPPVSNLYLNDGTGNFTVAGIPLAAVSAGDAAFADVDGDNDQDLLVTGRNGINRINVLYLNDGTGNFTIASTPFPKVRDSAIAFADVDGDADQDVIITGDDGFESKVSRLYTNDGTGNFTHSSSFTAVSDGSVDFADVDGDGDQDVLITGAKGWSIYSVEIAKLYLNDGTGNFNEASNTPFYGVDRSSADFSDVDQDGDLDVLIIGENFPNVASRLYLNDGAGNFTLMPDTPFPDIHAGSVAFADINGDNREDLLITGGIANYTTKLYVNGDNIVLDCPTGDVFLGSQQNVDSFVAQYPDCTEIIGSLNVSGGNLSPLSNYTFVGGYLSVRGNSLTSLNGLHNIDSVGGELRIFNADALTDLTGLDNLNYVGNCLKAEFNDNLITLTGLNNLNTINGCIFIRENNALSTLTDLENLTNIGANISIINNPNLSMCNAPIICDYLANEIFPNFQNNASGCNSVMEVEEDCMALPIELITPLNIYLDGKVTILRWRTATETNNAGFEIQKSKDGIIWKKIGWQQGQGNTLTPHAYAQRDENPFFGTSYYRFKQVDFNGDFKYSNVVSLQYIRSGISIFPNPNTGIFEVQSTAQGTYQILNTSGQIIQQGKMKNDLSVDISSTAQGIYFISVTIDNETFVKRIIKM